MSAPDKVSQILDSLREHIDEQKRLMDEENQRLLQKGKSAFTEALLNDILPQDRSSLHPAKSSTPKYLKFTLPHGLRQIVAFFRSRSQALNKSIHRIAYGVRKTLKRKSRRVEPTTRKTLDL